MDSTTDAFDEEDDEIYAWKRHLKILKQVEIHNLDTEAITHALYEYDVSEQEVRDILYGATAAPVAPSLPSSSSSSSSSSASASCSSVAAPTAAPADADAAAPADATIDVVAAVPSYETNMIYERPNFLRSVMEIDIDARMCEAFPEEEVSGGGRRQRV